jgi:hypothetical protein
MMSRWTQHKNCVACGRLTGPRMYCSKECERRPFPAVYRFVSPDGRSYVGSQGNIRNRDKRGIARANPRLMAAFEKHPPETWTYEILERLPAACSKERLRRAEQRHIERFKSWMPEHGFNIFPAFWKGTTPGTMAARKLRGDQHSALMKEHYERCRISEEKWRERWFARHPELIPKTLTKKEAPSTGERTGPSRITSVMLGM